LVEKFQADCVGKVSPFSAAEVRSLCGVAGVGVSCRKTRFNPKPVSFSVFAPLLLTHLPVGFCTSMQLTRLIGSIASKTSKFTNSMLLFGLKSETAARRLAGDIRVDLTRWLADLGVFLLKYAMSLVLPAVACL
jgi:hypothetical protein